MNTYYVARIIGRNEMYCCGERAETPELAALPEMRSEIHARSGERIGIWRHDYIGMRASIANADRGLMIPEWTRGTLVSVLD